MFKKILAAISMMMLSVAGMADTKCICTDNFGNGKKGCFSNVAQCAKLCNDNQMNMSWGGTCGGTIPPPLPMGQVRVDALVGSFWTDSKIDVNVGEMLTVKTIAVNGWQTNKYWIIGGADGHPSYRGGPNYVLPGAPEGALVGKIGNGPVFLIQSLGKTPAGSAGRLFLGPNDEVEGRYDNVGSITVDISAETAP